MKSKIKLNKKGFINLKVKAESIEDVRLLFHLLNNSDIAKILKKDKEYWLDKYKKCSCDIDPAQNLSTKLHDMGFDI